MSLLEIKGLEVKYITNAATIDAVNGIDLCINERECVGLVGETGAGKTTTAKSIMGLIPHPPGKILGGEICFEGADLLELNEKEMRKIRGDKISMIFQDPMSALNPTMKIVDQIAEVILLHSKCSEFEANARAVEILEKVGIRRERASEYPHQFSGGMKQRVVIAIALACNPNLLIADEPTTALDVTIQAQILELMRELKEEFGTSLLMITHDLGIVAQICDKAGTMYAGEIVEFGNLEQIFDHTAHPYTIGLFNSIPKLNDEAERLEPIAGLMADPANLPKGCKFNPRCPRCMDICKTENPSVVDIGDGHLVKCHLFEQANAEGENG